jgi:tellurite resistance protein TerC
MRGQTLAQPKRWLRIIGGFALLGIGTVMLVLPGPGLVTMALGLTLLGVEFAWARRLLARVRGHANTVRNAVRRRRD